MGRFDSFKWPEKAFELFGHFSAVSDIGLGVIFTTESFVRADEWGLIRSPALLGWVDLAPASRTVREAGARSTEHCLDLAVPDWNQEGAFAREQLALISLASSGRTYAPVLVALDEDGNAAVRASSGRATGARGKVGSVCADTAGGPSVVSPLPGSRRGVGRIPGRVPGRGRPGPGDGPTNPGLPGTC